VNYDVKSTLTPECLINRYYDAVTAQFISVDPLVGMTRQAYAYAADNPVNETDPNGDYFISGKAGAALVCVVMVAASHGVVNCGRHEGRNWPGDPDGGSRYELVVPRPKDNKWKVSLPPREQSVGRGWYNLPHPGPAWGSRIVGGVVAAVWFLEANPELALLGG
jgi:RHS repeat-associated protein